MRMSSALEQIEHYDEEIKIIEDVRRFEEVILLLCIITI